MKYLFLIFFTLSTTGYAHYTPVHQGVQEMQDVTFKLLKAASETECAEVIAQNEKSLTKALELIRNYQYFKESRTIKLLKLQGAEQRPRATSIPFTMPLAVPFKGMFVQQPDEVSVLPPNTEPSGNHVWCTFHIQCIDKKTERFSIAFYKTFNGELNHLGTFTYDIEEPTPWSAVFVEILNAGLGATTAQLFSSFAYGFKVPAHYGSNIPSTIAGIHAFLVTYFSFTPYTFFEGTSLDIDELSKECEAFFLALAGTAYLNPTSIDPVSMTRLWLFYLAMGTLRNSDFWYASTEKLEALQEWLQGYSTEIMSAALVSGALATIAQYASHRQYVDNQALRIAILQRILQSLQ